MFHEELMCNSASNYARHSLPARSTSTATVVSDSVFLLVGVVGVARAETVAKGIVVIWTAIAISNHESNRCAQRDIVHQAAEPLDMVGLAAGSGGLRWCVTFATAPQLDEYKVLVNHSSCRTTVDNATNGRAV